VPIVSAHTRSPHGPSAAAAFAASSLVPLLFGDLYRKASRNRAACSQPVTDIRSAECGAECGSSSTSERTDSDSSDVSVDDVDDARGSGCAADPDGLTAASRLRLIVASEHRRQLGQLADESTSDGRRPSQSNSHQPRGQQQGSSPKKEVGTPETRLRRKLSYIAFQ